MEEREMTKIIVQSAKVRTCNIEVSYPINQAHKVGSLGCHEYMIKVAIVKLKLPVEAQKSTTPRGI